MSWAPTEAGRDIAMRAANLIFAMEADDQVEAYRRVHEVLTESVLRRRVNAQRAPTSTAAMPAKMLPFVRGTTTRKRARTGAR